MPHLTDRKAFPGPDYHIEVTLPVPLEYAFAWCTDFSPEDSALEGESYSRKVIERGPRRVVFEDVEEIPRGWDWARYEVTLRPPDRWHALRTGNHALALLDYRLTPLSGGRTRFELTWRRRPSLLEFTKMSKAARERGTVVAWKRFARAMGRDYRKSQRKRRR